MKVIECVKADRKEVEKVFQGRVARLVSTQKIQIIDEDLSVLRDDELLVRMEVVGICGSDLHYFQHGGLGTSKIKFPLVMGHEPAGVIQDSFKSQKFRKGDRVAIEPGLSCLACEMCIRGQHNLCQNGTFSGSAVAEGCFKTFVAVNERQLVKIPDSITMQEAALLEPLGVAYDSIRLAGLKPGAKVAILGSGPIGLLILAMANFAGAAETFVIDKLGYRLEVAKHLYNADHIINESRDNPVAYIKAATKGKGVDVAFDAAGMQKTVDECFEITSPGGKIILVGIPTYDYLTYNPHLGRIKGLTIINQRRSNNTLHVCLELVMLKKIRLDGLVTHTFDLENIQQAFELAGNYHEGVIKAVINF